MAEVNAVALSIYDQEDMLGLHAFLEERETSLNYPKDCLRIFAAIAIETERDDEQCVMNRQVIGACAMGIVDDKLHNIASGEVEFDLGFAVDRVVVARNDRTVETVEAFADLAETIRQRTASELQTTLRPDPASITALRAIAPVVELPQEEKLAPMVIVIPPAVPIPRALAEI
jgi:hypothetical protein